MTLRWRCAAASDVGLLRDGNEDSAYAGVRLLAVADGMGGHAAGEVASAAAIAALEPLDVPETRGDPATALREALVGANAHLRDMVAAERSLHGMGTTVTALLSDGDHSVLAHIGDSRAYLYRDGRLTQLTHDHTLVQQMVDDGRLRPEDASTHPQRSLITRALDGRDPVELDVSVEEFRAGDRLLLCTDGLSGVVSDENLAAVLAEGDPESAVRRLIELALRGGGPDNVTCIVADAYLEETAAGAHDPASTAPRAVDIRTDPASPAARAAALGSAARDDDPRARARHLRRRRTAIVAAVTAVLLAILAGAGWSWVRSQYYVSVADGQVAIYRGVDGSVAGIDLSTVESKAPVPIGVLPPFEQSRVTDGIHAANLDDAAAIVSRLEAEARRLCAARVASSASPSPLPSPSLPAVTPALCPTPTPLPGSSPAPARTPSRTPTPSRT